MSDVCYDIEDLNKQMGSYLKMSGRVSSPRNLDDEIIQIIIEQLNKGADPNVEVSNKSALLYAINSGSPQLVQELISFGAELSPSFIQPGSLFSHAIKSMMKQLSKISSDAFDEDDYVDVSKEKNLTFANFKQIIDILFENGIRCTPESIQNTRRATLPVVLPLHMVDPLITIASNYMIIANNYNTYGDEFKSLIETFINSGCDPRPVRDYINNLDKTREVEQISISITRGVFDNLDELCAEFERNQILIDIEEGDFLNSKQDILKIKKM